MAAKPSPAMGAGGRSTAADALHGKDSKQFLKALKSLEDELRTADDQDVPFRQTCPSPLHDCLREKIVYYHCYYSSHGNNKTVISAPPPCQIPRRFLA